MHEWQAVGIHLMESAAKVQHHPWTCTQMDVKLLSVFGTSTATAGIGPHSKIYYFLNQVDILENIQARQTQQIN